MLGKPLSFTGTLKQRNILDAKGLNEKLTLEVPDAGKVVLTMMLPEKLPLDLVVGRDIQVDYWDRVGFGGSARGIRIRDGKGIILLADDGNYGMAVQGDDTKPFTIGQEDANCRNRRNTPGDLNNFYLVVSAEGKSVKLIHGGSAELDADGRIFTVLAVRSTARVGNVKWTDAPYSYKAYVIARMPKK